MEIKTERQRLCEDLAQLLGMEGFEGEMEVPSWKELYALALREDEAGGPCKGTDSVLQLGRRLSTKQLQSLAIFALVQYFQYVMAEEAEKAQRRRHN